MIGGIGLTTGMKQRQTCIAFNLVTDPPQSHRSLHEKVEISVTLIYLLVA
jgi:hypothetical protein